MGIHTCCFGVFQCLGILVSLLSYHVSLIALLSGDSSVASMLCWHNSYALLSPDCFTLCTVRSVASVLCWHVPRSEFLFRSQRLSFAITAQAFMLDAK